MAYPIYSEVCPILEISEDECIVLNDTRTLDYDSICTSTDDGVFNKCDDLNSNTFAYTHYRDNDYEGNIDLVNNFIRITSMTASTFLLINLMRNLKLNSNRK